jgi:hypothetical protein
MIRGDLSSRLIHLTRPTDQLDVGAVFANIVREGQLRGSRNDVAGRFSCVCFTEAPLTALAQVMAANPTSMRYQPFGVMVTKDWLYAKGGRPVIYGEPAEFKDLPDTMKYRYVRYELGKVDWTWEREWRIQTNALVLDPAQTTLIVPRRSIAQAYHATEAEQNSMLSFAVPEVAFAFSEPSQWHFVALEDLGIDFPETPNT